jgi:ABC-type transport system involved in cytochrome c biogenesis permease subunit
VKPPEILFLAGGLIAFAAGSAAAFGAIRAGSDRFIAAVRVSAILGACCFAALLTTVGAREGRFPVGSTFEAFVFLAAATSVAALLLDLWRRMPILMIATLPLSLLTALLALSLTLTPPPPPAPPDGANLSSVRIAVHVAVALASYAAFAMAFASGIVYLVSQRLLKKHGPSPVFGLMPPLETTARVNVRSIAAGVVLLAIGLVVGYLYAREIYAGQRVWRLDPKVFLTTITVLAYAAVLGLSRRPRFKGRRTALASVAGFVLVLATFWANVFWSRFHSF